MAFGTSSTRGDGASVADALVIRDLHVQFHTRRGVYKALNGVSLRLRRGEVLGIAGESGCGKTTMGLAVMALLPRNASFPQGQIIFDNKDLMNLDRKSTRLNSSHSQISYAVFCLKKKKYREVCTLKSS